MTPRLIDTERYFGWQVDFARPIGEPAYCAPDSVSWRIFKNPVVLAIGGICAVLLEFADPRIRTGVWEHSSFRADPVGRAKRTGLAAMVGVYGPQTAARRVIQGITHLHQRVDGVTPDGTPYRALDPELMAWVSATAQFGFLSAYDRFAGTLSAVDQQRYLKEGGAVAALYGVQRRIQSPADFDAMLAERIDGFEPHPIVFDFLETMSSGQAAPQVPKQLHRALVRAAVDLLPKQVRSRLNIGPEFDLSWRAEKAVAAMVTLSERVPDLDGPAAQACERIGLPRNYLWRTRQTQARLLGARAIQDRSLGHGEIHQG